MISSAFIFEDGALDEAFFALDSEIETIAERTDGFLGKERWVSADGTRRNSTYYWRDEAALKAFSQDEKHIEAKLQYQKWYKGFHVIIAEVRKTYGDGGIETFLPDDRSARRAG